MTDFDATDFEGVVIFQAPYGESGLNSRPSQEIADDASIEYLRGRESAERAAAKRATSAAARHVHQELAQQYAELVRQAGGPTLPMTYDISMGVRRGDVDLKREVEAALSKRAADIHSVLADYGVVLVEPR